MHPVLEVAAIFRRHGDADRAAHGAHMGCARRRIMGAIEVCRTAALGGHVERCDNCAHQRIAYNSWPANGIRWRRLRFFGDLAPLARRPAFARQVKCLRMINWIVCAKPPFGAPEQVLA